MPSGGGDGRGGGHGGRGMKSGQGVKSGGGRPEPVEIWTRVQLTEKPALKKAEKE